jgi:hypothetical protein
MIDERWDADEREGVGIHLRHGVVARSFLGSSKCRLCEQYVGNLELTDGVYVWPEGLAHYVVEHLVRLPAEFVEHVDQHAGAVDECVREPRRPSDSPPGLAARRNQ